MVKTVINIKGNATQNLNMGGAFLFQLVLFYSNVNT